MPNDVIPSAATTSGHGAELVTNPHSVPPHMLSDGQVAETADRRSRGENHLNRLVFVQNHHEDTRTAREQR